MSARKRGTWGGEKKAANHERGGEELGKTRLKSRFLLSKKKGKSR